MYCARHTFYFGCQGGSSSDPRGRVMVRGKPAAEKHTEKQPPDPYSNAQNPAHLAWCGLHIGTYKNRTLGGSAGVGPCLPLRFITEPISLAAFQKDAQAACQAFDTLLSVPELQEALEQQVDDLSVDDLLEPGPAEILAATTYEVEHRSAPQASDVAWQPWYIQQEQGAGLRRKGRRQHTPAPANASAAAATSLSVAAAPDGISVQQQVQLLGNADQAASSGAQEVQAKPGGRPPKRPRRPSAKALAAAAAAAAADTADPGPEATAGEAPQLTTDQPQIADVGGVPSAGNEASPAPADTSAAGAAPVGGSADAAGAANASGMNAANGVGAIVLPDGMNGVVPNQQGGVAAGVSLPAAVPVAPVTITLQRKLPDEMTVGEWVLTYAQHAWVFDRLGVPPPHLANFATQMPGGGLQPAAMQEAAVNGQPAAVTGQDTTLQSAAGPAGQEQLPAQQQGASELAVQPQEEPPQEEEEQGPAAKKRRGPQRASKARKKGAAAAATAAAAGAATADDVNQAAEQPPLALPPLDPGHDAPPAAAVMDNLPLVPMFELDEVPAPAATIRADLISAWRGRFQQASSVLQTVQDLEAQHWKHAAQMRGQKEKQKAEQQGGRGAGGKGAAGGVAPGTSAGGNQQQQQAGRSTTPSLFSGEDDYDTFDAPQDAALLGQLQAASAAQPGGASTTQQQQQGPGAKPPPARDGRSLNRGKKVAESGDIPVDLLLVRSALSAFNREGQMRAAARSAEAALQADLLRLQMATAANPLADIDMLNLPVLAGMQANPAAFQSPTPAGAEGSTLTAPAEGGGADGAVAVAASDELDPSSDEVLVNVAVYAPRRSDFLSDDLLLLGSQPLSALRDAIHCVAQANLAAANMQGSGGAYFFAEGRFFSDVRTPGAEDLATPIVNLCRSKGVVPTHMVNQPGQGHHMNLVPQQEYLEEMQLHSPAQQQEQQRQPPHPSGTTQGGAESAADAAGGQQEPAAGPAHGPGDILTNQPMHQVPLASLTARLSNYPTYLFCHLGCCEHLVQIRDVRRLHPGDPLRRSAYPLQLLPVRSFATTRAARRCDVCGSNLATIAAYDDPLGPANPCFYCKSCQGYLHPGGVAPPGTKLFPYSHTSAGIGADG